MFLSSKNINMYYRIFACSTQRRLMRIPTFRKTLKNFLCLVLLFLVVNTLFIPATSSQDNPELLIEVYDSNDWNESAGAIIFEGRLYDITVCTENDSVIMGVNITFLGTTYQTSLSEPFLTIEAPPYSESDTVIIN